MVDWTSREIRRPRHKTVHRNGNNGAENQCHKLWPITVTLLKAEMTKGSGVDLMLLTNTGKPLFQGRIKPDGSLAVTNIVKLAFDRVKKKLKMPCRRGLKSLRKSAANEIEKINPALTSLFLAHSDSRVAKHYVTRHYTELFEVIDRLDRDIYKLGDL